MSGVNMISQSSKWVRCPLCGEKTRVKVYADTVLLNFPLYCPKCKQETRINIVKLNMLTDVEPS